MTSKKIQDNERAEEMTYEFRTMPNLKMLRETARQEEGAAVVPEPEVETQPAEAPKGAGRTR